MKKVKSLSEKRLIIEGTVNGKQAFFLVDTGASVGLMDERKRKKLGLVRGRKYPGTLVGAGGEVEDIYICDTFAEFYGCTIPQFLLADISAVADSIRRETGYELAGIISLPQMKMAGMQVDANDNLVIFENLGEEVKDGKQ